MRLWINVCGIPAALAVLGFLLLYSVESLRFGTHLGQYREHVLYASVAAFALAAGFTLRGLWVVLRRKSQ